MVRIGAFLANARRRLMPERFNIGDDTVPLITRGGGQHPILPRVGRFVKKYKRNIALVGGTIAGVAAFAGGLAGGLSSSTDMREGNSGVLGQIVKGVGTGGGGGGGGSYAQGSYYTSRPMTARKRGRVKRLGGKRKKVGKKMGYGKRRKVGKSSGKQKRINKRRKVGKKKRFAAF